MSYTVRPMTRDDVETIRTWRYAGPYAVYNLDMEGATGAALEDEMLDLRSPWFAVRDATGDLIGFFAYGSAADIGTPATPHVLDTDGTLSIGLGMRPDMTGSGAGLSFVHAGLEFARDRFAPTAFQLYVLSWNRRAVRVYERAGFRQVGTIRQRSEGGGEREFIEMWRAA